MYLIAASFSKGSVTSLTCVKSTGINPTRVTEALDCEGVLYSYVQIYGFVCMLLHCDFMLLVSMYLHKNEHRGMSVYRRGQHCSTP